MLRAFLALLVVGCHPPSPDGGGGDALVRGGVSPDSVSTMPSESSDSLRFRIDVPSRVRAGEPVPIVLRLENVADRPVEVYLRGRTIAFDVVVERADGPVVWRRLEGEVIPAIVQLKVLRPGEVLELRARWDQRTNRGEPVGPGTYTVHGVLPGDDPLPLKTPAATLRTAPA